MRAQYVNHMGDDLTVVNAARVSFSKHKEEMDDSDVRLINYLARHNHFTPFTHPQITLRMSAPIPIRTQCFKHKVGFSENEESRRYIKSTPKLFIPESFRSAPENAKQGSGGTHEHNLLWMDVYRQTCEEAIEIYEQMIEDGVAPEQARLVLPQGVEVQWIWTGSLAAFARLVRQREDPHAQKEIQQLAQEVSDIISPLFPVSWEALTNE